MDSSDFEIIATLESALQSEYGIAVYSPDVDKLRRRIYIIRRKLAEEGDARFSALSLTTPLSRPDCLFIIPTALLVQERQKE